MIARPLASAVGTHRSGLCPHSHAPLCWVSLLLCGLISIVASSLSASGSEIEDRSPFLTLHTETSMPADMACETSGGANVWLRAPFSALSWLLKVIRALRREHHSLQPLFLFSFFPGLPPLPSLSSVPQHCGCLYFCYGTCSSLVRSPAVLCLVWPPCGTVPQIPGPSKAKENGLGPQMHPVVRLSLPVPEVAEHLGPLPPPTSSPPLQHGLHSAGLTSAPPCTPLLGLSSMLFRAGFQHFTRSGASSQRGLQLSTQKQSRTEGGHTH